MLAFLPSAHELQVARWTASELRRCPEYSLDKEVLSNSKGATLEVRSLENLETSDRVGDNTVLRQMAGPTISYQSDDLMFPAETDYPVTPSEMENPTTPERIENFVDLWKALYELASNEKIDGLTTSGTVTATEIAASPFAIYDFACRPNNRKFHLFGNAATENPVALQSETSHTEPTTPQADDKFIPEQLRELLPDSGYSSAPPTPDEDEMGQP